MERSRSRLHPSYPAFSAGHCGLDVCLYVKIEFGRAAWHLILVFGYDYGILLHLSDGEYLTDVMRGI